MPTFNHAPFIDHAIRSAVEQDYPNLEVVVGDDGSTDGTREKVDDWALRYPGRVVACEGGRLGLVANHNRVLHACRGKYLAHISGDDLFLPGFLPGKIARQVAWMEEDDERVMCGHDVEAFDSDSGATLYSTHDTIPLTTGRGAERFVRRMQLMPGISCFIRKSAVPPGGYDERVGVVSDFKYLADVLSGGGKYGFIDGVFARYRVHRDAVSQRSLREDAVARQYLEGFLTAFALLEAEHPALIAACREGRARVFFAEGRRRQKRGEMEAARAFFAQALRERPGLFAAKSVAGLALTFARRPVP
jgi:glycosyltransferase involved in cell wall biosynthesis